jgi:hypothetical protein
MLRRPVSQLPSRKATRCDEDSMEGPVECRPFVVDSSMGELCEALRNEAENGQDRLIDRLIKFVVEQEQFHARS